MSDVDFQNAASEQALATNSEYKAAFDEYMAAAGDKNKQANAAVRMEQAALAGNKPLDLSQVSITPLKNNQVYLDLLQKASSAPTVAAREVFMREMEIIASRSAAANPSGDVSQNPLDGLEPAKHVGELAPPPELVPHIRDQEAFAGVQEAALSVGVPQAYWQASMLQAHENLHLLQATPEQYSAHVDKVVEGLEKAYGNENLQQVVNDATAFFNALANADKRLGEAAYLLKASPVAITQAAQLWRSGYRPQVKR